MVRLERVGINAGAQLLQNHGKITNISGLVEAYFGLGAGQGTLEATAFAGLNLAEQASRNKHNLTAVDWFDFAAAAITAVATPGAQTDASGAVPAAGHFDWRMVAGQALYTGVRSIIAARSEGEDAALQAIGTGIGQSLGNYLTDQPIATPLVQAVVSGNLGRALSNDWASLTHDMRQGAEAVASFFDVNTAGDSVNNSALNQASGAEGG